MALTDSLLFKSLCESIAKNQLLALHTFDDLNEFELGLILQVSDSYYAMLTILEEGEQGPIQVGRIGDIRRLSVGGPYIEAFAPSCTLIQMPRLLKDLHVDQGFEGVISWSIAGGRVISITERSGTRTHGPSKGCDSSSCCQAVYTKGGEYKGDEILWLSDIKAIEFDGPMQRRIENILFAKNQHNITPQV